MINQISLKWRLVGMVVDKDIKVWKVLTQLDFDNTSEGVSMLLSKGYRVSEWVEDIYCRDSSEKVNINFPVKLARVEVSSLGFTEPVTLTKIYERLGTFGLGLVSPELALSCRMNYSEQPTGEWLRFATPLHSMIDSDGVPHLPKLGRALGHYFIATYWAYENAIFYPHNEFVVALNN